MARIAFNESIGTDRGEAIVGAMVVHLRQNSILLPSAAVLEKIALVERARARKQAYKELTAGIDHTVRDKLDALILVADDETRTPLAWLREWPEAPVQKNLAGIVERLQSVRVIGVEPDRERRIYRARYAAIARETAILSAQHLCRFDCRFHSTARRTLGPLAEAVRERAGVTLEQVDAEYGDDPQARGPLNWARVQAILRAIDTYGGGSRISP
jgi:hypothetical protein